MRTTKATTHRDMGPVPMEEPYVADCIRCSSERAEYRYWETVGDDGVNEHWSVHCPECGYDDSDALSAMQRDQGHAA